MPKTKPSPQRPVEQPGTPRTLCLEATATVHLEAAGTGDGAAPLPRFRMVAYTGTPMRVAGWRHPVVLDLDGHDDLGVGDLLGRDLHVDAPAT